MTLKQMYNHLLTELNKVNAPSLLLEDFNYLVNRAVNLYINRRYNLYDMNQLTTDDLRVIKATTILKPVPCAWRYESDWEDYVEPDIDGNKDPKNYNLTDSIYNATYEVDLPDDYLHLLNCICIYKVKLDFECYNLGYRWHKKATRLDADKWGEVINNFYMRPTYKRPYYYIHNVNQLVDRSTNPVQFDENGRLIYGTDVNYNAENTFDVRFEVNPISLYWNNGDNNSPKNLLIVSQKIEKDSDGNVISTTNLGYTVIVDTSHYIYSLSETGITVLLNTTYGLNGNVGNMQIILEETGNTKKVSLIESAQPKIWKIYYGFLNYSDNYITDVKNMIEDYVSNMDSIEVKTNQTFYTTTVTGPTKNLMVIMYPNDKDLKNVMTHEGTASVQTNWDIQEDDEITKTNWEIRLITTENAGFSRILFDLYF